ncbi:hypothetical protein UP10_04935 [Bradyrhizobium sp. LTSPM299]|uniref:DUF2867 domain-containing protein n=1 Tax=Bradyrhizobium sp. LTSPM299 TaxID=1619233 RepID=UPI0005CB06DB|nr:DUF2867 domain-containing protein [Bradyrhizobium sp. LTSPM299]KJC61735.1 hypothetical protein UP10_04935 [Bradyrhizobium sp. LTSPM299]
MKVDEITPNADSTALLAGAQFMDAFRIETEHSDLDARHAAEVMVEQQPRWFETLQTLRNILVKPFGLKTSGAERGVPRDMIGIFPVVSQTQARLVAGFNDKHLDFRIVVDVAAAGNGRNVTLTMLVLTHNSLGRAYLALIMPFHRLIVPAMLRKVAN